VIYQNKYTNSGSQAQGKSWKLLILFGIFFSGNRLKPVPIFLKFLLPKNFKKLISRVGNFQKIVSP